MPKIKLIEKGKRNMNKVVLVTGSSRGIGRATIIEFAKKGYNVVINYVKSENEANTLKNEIEENYARGGKGFSN